MKARLPLILVTLSTILLAACSESYVEPHACQGFDTDLARGTNDAELRASRRALIERRESCDEAQQFMTLFTANLMESAVTLNASRAAQVGHTYCQNRFARNANKKSGCEVGIQESMQYTPGVADYFGHYTGGGNGDREEVDAAESAQQRQAIDRARRHASGVSSQISSRRIQIADTLNSLTELDRAKRGRDEAKQNLESTKAELTAAQERAANLKRDEHSIRQNLATATNNLRIAQSQLQAVQNRVAPKKQQLQASETSRNQAQRRLNQAQSNLQNTQSNISAANAEIIRLHNETNYYNNY